MKEVNINNKYFKSFLFPFQKGQKIKFKLLKNNLQ